MKKYNISVPKKYTKDGEEKTSWKTVGTLIKFEATETKPEGFAIELPIFGDVKFFVFEEKQREGQAQAPEPKASTGEADIPFDGEEIW